MFDKYLLIENPGVASVEAFTLLGASNKAGTDAIGQFGSGTKFGVLSLLREGTPPVVCAGLTRIEFFTKAKTFDGAEHQQVAVRLSGKTLEGKNVGRTEDLSLVLRYGEIDWKDPRLALREFVSNALDAVNGDATQVRVCVVDGVKAKAGFTRVYVPLTPAAQDFNDHLHKWFLHFNPEAVWRTSAIIKKPGETPARIYRRGVFVREVENKTSLFDYNLNHLPLDEARIANDWNVAYYAAAALRQCRDVEVASRVLLAREGVWESSFTLYDEYDRQSQTEAAREATDRVWREAQANVLAEGFVFAHERDDTSVAEGKGYKVRKVPENVFKLVSGRGLRTQASILTADERNGRRVDAETHLSAIDAVNHVWNKLEALGETRGENKPLVKSFSSGLTGGAATHGYYRDGTVYLNTAYLTEPEYRISNDLFKTVLEEIAHHVTKAADNSRDFQDYLLSVIARILCA